MPDVAEDAAKRADEERAMRLILDELRSLTEPEREVLATAPPLLRVVPDDERSHRGR